MTSTKLSLMLTLCERLFYTFWGKNTEKRRENLRILDMDWVTRANYRMKCIKRNKSDPNHVYCLCQPTTMYLTRSLWALGWLSVVVKTKPVPDPCLAIAGKQWVLPREARACMSAFPLDPVIKANVGVELPSLRSLNIED